MLIDSNIVIYSGVPEYGFIRDFLTENDPCVSAISMVEVLGFHKLTEEERQHFEQFFAAAEILPLSREVLYQAVQLRQKRKMKLGDALIAATALVFGHSLATRNTADFKWVDGLKVINPFENQETSS